MPRAPVAGERVTLPHVTLTVRWGLSTLGWRPTRNQDSISAKSASDRTTSVGLRGEFQVWRSTGRTGDNSGHLAMVYQPCEGEGTAFDSVSMLRLRAELINRVVHGRGQQVTTPSGRSASRGSGGGVTSRWYLPVSAPPARGENGVNARSRSAQIDRTVRSSWGPSRL